MSPDRRSTLRRLAAACAAACATPPRLALLAAPAALPLQAQDLPKTEPQPVMAGPYVPSPETVVSQMLDMAGVGPDDVLIDMGSGDGRIVLTAAKLRGARGLGIEIQEKLVRLSIEAAQREGIADRARFVRQDLFATDVSSATVVTLYLLPDTVNMLRDKLRRELRPGTRVLTHDYPIAGWLPETWKQFDEPEKKGATGQPSAVVYLYRIPAQVGGRWQASVPTAFTRQRVQLDLRQQWQMLDGMASVGGREVPLDDVRLSGDSVAFRLRLDGSRSARFEGRARDGVIEGTATLDGAALPWRAARV
ncbi:MAG: methyltransferase domain-containing protein [Burkholderiales bacterium]|nr:MAG: methyltransferase domain-containing protein [Burkholderiales bacterium]